MTAITPEILAQSAVTTINAALQAMAAQEAALSFVGPPAPLTDEQLAMIRWAENEARQHELKIQETKLRLLDAYSDSENFLELLRTLYPTPPSPPAKP